MFADYSLWDRLTGAKKPLLLYGTGNGGDKIIRALDSYGVKLDGIFASDGFVRGKTFHDMPVLSYDDVIRTYGEDITVLLAFGTTLPDVTAFIRMLDQRHELIIPEVPLYGGDLFDMAYLRAHRDQLDHALSLFEEEQSRRLFCDAVNFRLTGKLDCLTRTESFCESLKDRFRYSSIRHVLDGGAYRGDSTADFVNALHPDVITAVEADPRTYQKLCEYGAGVTDCQILPIHAALADYDGEMGYVSSASRGSGKQGANRRAKTVTIPACTIDSLCGNSPVDLIKLDVEGAEMASLNGARKVLNEQAPHLVLSLYHRTDDLFLLPETVHALLPDHKLYLRRVPCIPLWDLTLYAVRPE